MTRVLFSLAVIALQTAAPVIPERRVTQEVHSNSLPSITVGVDATLSYIGRVEFEVGGRARAERFLFSEITDGRLGRTAIVHFEHFLPDNDFTFSYPTFRQIELNGDQYLHQTWPVRDFPAFKEPSLRKLLTSRGLSAEEDWIVNRYARAMPENPKYELLLFYLEPASSVSVPLEALTSTAHPSGVPQQPGPWMDVAAAIADRARAVFSIRAVGSAR